MAMQDIDKILSLEIKRELAGRYFGFRKLIEDDIKDYDQQVLNSFYQLEQNIGFNLIRLYILLNDEDLIHNFFQLAGFRDDIFFDPYLLESRTIKKRVFKNIKTRGITRSQRFKNLFFDLYTELTLCVKEYRTTLGKLALEQATITEQIKLFKRKHDLGTIMDFLRGLDATTTKGTGYAEGTPLMQHGSSLEKKMQMEPPQPVENILPVFPQLTPLKTIKTDLKKLIKRAFELQGQPEIKDFVR